jgi:hypothetical protein
MLWLTLATSCFDSAIPNLLPRIFEDKIRSSGVATSYSLGLALAGVVSVLVSTLVVRANHSIWLIPLIIFSIHIVFISWSALIINKNKLLYS